MNEELRQALEGLKAKFETKNAELIKESLDGFKKEFEGQFSTKMAELKKADGEAFAELRGQVTDLLEVKSQFQALQKQADELDVKMQAIKNTGDRSGGEELTNEQMYFKSMTSTIKDGFDQIKSLRKGSGVTLEVKAVGDMTATANLTGDVVKTYQGGVSAIPAQKINFDQLVATINSATGVYVAYRETGSEGGITQQTTPGTSKSQIDFDFTEVVYNANYLSGFVRYAKQMAQDLPFLTSFLPEALRRKYYKAENAQFYATLKAAATASTNTTGEVIERMILDIGALEALDFDVNGIVINPADWAIIANTKPNDFSLPSVVNIANGVLTVNGVPVFKASWVDAGEYIVGDWSQAKKIVVDGLAVEFFEQDADNVTKNLITARVEQRTVLAIDLPQAFILGDAVVA